MEMTDGSFRVIPFPLKYTSTLAVPKSIPMSLNPNKKNLTFPHPYMELTCFDKTFEKPMNGIILSFYWNSSFFNKKNTIQLSNPVKPCFLFSAL
jgi:hypothetical protein